MPPHKRILLGQLAARGDCLYATAIARQIKNDFPDCHLTWAIGSMCRSVIENNPHVDAVWEVPLVNPDDVNAVWTRFYAEAQKRLRYGEFDHAYFPQIYPANFRNYDSTVRASMFRGYPHPITVPVAPVMRLRDDEIENVRRFAEAHRLTDHSPVIMFEFSGGSGQTFLNPEFAYNAARGIVKQLPDCRIVMTSHIEIESLDPRVISGHALTFRENAELTKYCSLLIGCSSGITWLCTSDWAKPLPTIQLLAGQIGVYASVIHDHERFGLATDTIIEMTNCPVEDLVDCTLSVCRDGFAEAKKYYHVRLQPAFNFFLPMTINRIRQGAYRDALGFNWQILRRYGLRREVLEFNLRTLKHLIRFAAVRSASRVHRWFGRAGRPGK